ncbi:hypothetical protein [uncultured Bradyrhizobium sp.]|uniref:hypothetical protein n=1 Tax=Bradyrhizobium sp. TaxID=376 RepID=UPI0026227B1D|nr:hypothetical protein [uncultured Bradyrhizobium sp.]
MTSMTRLFATAISLLLLTAPAFPQTPGGRITLVEQPVPIRQEGTVRVQSNVNLFLPGPSGDGEEAQKLRDRARRTVYEMAARECDLLREVMAKDCRLESVNVNINVGRQYGQQQEGFNVSGSMSMQITLK